MHEIFKNNEKGIIMTGLGKPSKQNSTDALKIIVEAEESGTQLRVTKNGNIRKADRIENFFEVVYIKIFRGFGTNHGKLAREAVIKKLCNEISQNWAPKFDEAKKALLRTIPLTENFLNGDRKASDFQTNLKSQISYLRSIRRDISHKINFDDNEKKLQSNNIDNSNKRRLLKLEKIFGEINDGNFSEKLKLEINGATLTKSDNLAEDEKNSKIEPLAQKTTESSKINKKRFEMEPEEITRRANLINSALPHGMSFGTEIKTYSQVFQVFNSEEDVTKAIAEIKGLIPKDRTDSKQPADQYERDIGRICLSTELNNQMTNIQLNKGLAEQKFNEFCEEVIKSKANLNDDKKSKCLSNLKFALGHQLNQSAISIVYEPLMKSLKSKSGEFIQGIVPNQGDNSPDKQPDKEKAPIRYALSFQNGEIFIRYKEIKIIPGFSCGGEMIPISTDNELSSDNPNNFVRDNNFNFRLTWAIKLDVDELMECTAAAEFVELPKLEWRIKLSDKEI